MIAIALALALAATDGGPKVHYDIGGLDVEGVMPDAGPKHTHLDSIDVEGIKREDEAQAARAVEAKHQPLTLAATGDVTLGYHFEEYFDLRLDGGAWADAGPSPAQTKEELFKYPFAKVEPVLSKADIAVVNLECPFTSRGAKIAKNFNFRASPELGGALKPGGVQVVTIANNHLMDYGPDGVRDTIDTLDKLGIAHFGAGMNLAEARKPAIIERKGQKIAFLGYLYIGNPPIEPVVVWATKDKPGVSGAAGDIDALEKMINEDVKAAKKKADIVVVFFHFGKEGLHEIQPYQATLAHAAVDAGANLVLGSHPHVLQGAERYNGVPIVYSLGNFVFGGNANPGNKESAIFTATLVGKKVTQTGFVPVQITRFPDAPFQPFPLDGEAKKLILQHLADYSKAFPEPLVK